MIMSAFITLNEAAALANLAPDEFARRAPANGIGPVVWFNSALYRRADIEASMESAWRLFAETPAGKRHRASPRALSSTDEALARLPKPKKR